MSQKIKDPPSSSDTDADAIRLDLWLYYTRLVKSRNLAARMIEKGKIRLTRHGQTERIRKTHKLIRSGDEISLMRAGHFIQVLMLKPGMRRGPAIEAQTLYETISNED